MSENSATSTTAAVEDPTLRIRALRAFFVDDCIP
jgi:hypothetical protein